MVDGNRTESTYDDSNVELDFSPYRDSSWPNYKEGSLLEATLLESSRELQVDKSMVTLAAFGAISTACQGIFDIEQPTGNKVAGSLMLLIIAESGERKTTVEKCFFNALRDVQKKYFEEHSENKIGYEQEYEIWKVSDSSLKSEYKKAVRNFARNKDNESSSDLLRLEGFLRDHKGRVPREPKRLKFIYEDSTPMALLQAMYFQGRNACLLSSEANSIFHGRAFNDLSLINSLWDGREIFVDRVSSESFHLSDARLTLMLMAQEDVIKRFISKRGEEARGIGFLARFLTIKPAGRAGKRQFRCMGKLDYLDGFSKRISELMVLSNKGNEKKLLKFTPRASERWRQYAEKIENEMNTGLLYEHYHDHASKLMDNVSRVAGLVHYFESQNEDEIEEDTLIFAFEVVVRCSNHFLMHLAGTPFVVKNAETIVGEIFKLVKSNQNNLNRKVFEDPETSLKLRRGVLIDFNYSDVARSGAAVLRDRKNFNAAVRLLARMGHIKENKGPRSSFSYSFSESIVHEADSPEMKNGFQYTIRNLPLYEDQVLKVLETNHGNGYSAIPHSRRAKKEYFILVDKYDKG
ncbi:YfjI family protein [Marinobacterium rhizophilum]|uniref:DUF3987 domain-containing protein n=1 Tax=Marinobacterium rhizophilum TaxID=420402 RepID=A0ABY5HL58_9GAMM|nr:DUF3987 domain-containing protein [Marinobacterium rhizophilum]UTW11989.1 DUF3987 domain-containing protein [Marinobacterium rhizophilum]